MLTVLEPGLDDILSSSKKIMQIYQNQCAAGARKHYYFFGQHQIKDDVYYQIITQVQQVPFPFSTSGIFLPVTVLKTVARMIGNQPPPHYYIAQSLSARENAARERVTFLMIKDVSNREDKLGSKC